MRLPTQFIRKNIPKKYIYETLITFGGLILLAVVVSFISPYTPKTDLTFAEKSSDGSASLYRAEVASINETSVSVVLKDGPGKGVSVEIPHKDPANKDEFKEGVTVIVSDSQQQNGFVFYDLLRLPALIVIVGIFVVTVLLVGRRRGLMSLAGLGASIIVIGWVIVPLVLAGYNSLLVSVLGAYVIAIASIVIAHGFKRRTFISLLCVLIILLLVTIASQIVVSLIGLSGMIDDVSYYLKVSHPEINLSGILVGGIVIAALGALDDVVTTQVAAVDELKKANKSLSVRGLYKKAFSVGSEHIAALVNTLALVYAGAALPLVVAYAASSPQLFQLFNGEFVATEIVRTVIVSVGLVLSVPVSTWVAAVMLSKYYDGKEKHLSK